MNPRSKGSPLGLFALLLLVQPAAAIPYTPSSLFLAPQYNNSLAYLLQPSSSTGKTEFLSLNISASVDTSNPSLHALLEETPFKSNEQASAFIPVIDDQGVLSVYAGDCHNASDQSLWRFRPDNTSSTGNGSWEQLSVNTGEGQSNPNYLAAGFTFASSDATESSMYTFGGMCPLANSTDQTWVSAADYSQSMVLLGPTSQNISKYDATTIGHRAPPVPEAGMVVVSLPATSSLVSTEKQQDFLFIGGHTREAFLNMSQLAIFSVPQESWSFVNVNSEARSRTELTVRTQAAVEPRSGHAAVLSNDGKKIYVIGGWVGDTSIPADPQFAVLEVGEEYGGVSEWAWSIPSSSSEAGIAEGTGLFGHSAAMLSGDVLMIAGGYAIPKQSSKRSMASIQRNFQIYLYNTTSGSWVRTYTNPSASTTAASKSHGNSLSSGQKAGLGVGLGLLLPIAIIAAICAWRHRQKRRVRGQRDSQLRELALGAERAHFWGGDDHFQASSIRSSQMSEKHDSAATSPCLGNRSSTPRASRSEQSDRSAERTGLLMDTSPTKTSRPFSQQRPYRHSGYTEFRRHDTTSDIHPIDEREEDEAIFRERLMATIPATIPAREKTEVGAEELLSDTQFATPHSTIFGVGLGPFYSRRKDIGADAGRVSPTKSERTLSNLSEASSFSFSSNKPTGLVPKARGILVDRPLSWASSAGRSIDQLDPGHSRDTTQSDMDGVAARSENSFSTDSYSTAHTSLSQHRAENQSLLHDADALTPVESSPSKLSPSSKTQFSEGIFQSVRRALTLTRHGTSEAEPEAAPLASGIDRRSTVMVPSRGPDSGTSTPRRAVSASAELFRRKSAKDWIAKKRTSDGIFQTPRSTRDDIFLNAPGWLGDDDTCDESWDEDRRVQTTYSAPREKLRVVNASDMDDVSERSLSNAPSTRRVSN